MEATIHIHARWEKYQKKFIYSVEQIDMTCVGYAHIETRVIQFESPDDKLLQAQVAQALGKKRDKIMQAAFEESQLIQEEIQELLALTDHTIDAQSAQVEDDVPF